MTLSIFFGTGVTPSIKAKAADSFATGSDNIKTEIKTELQADGTYNVILETYATAKTQYKNEKLTDRRNTDYLFVLDASSNMINNSSCSGWRHFDSTLTMENVNQSENATKDPEGTGIQYDLTASRYYMRSADGKYYPIKTAINTTERKKTVGVLTIKQYYWAYYVDDAGKYYAFINGNSANLAEYADRTAFETAVANLENSAASSSKRNNSDRKGTTVVSGAHYRYIDGSSEQATAMECMQTSVQAMINNIASGTTNSRIAVTQFGSSSSDYSKTGYYRTDGDSYQFIQAITGTQAQYKTAWIDASDKTSVNTLLGHIDNMYVSEGSSENAKGNYGTVNAYANHGLDLAKSIAVNSDSDYSATGDRTLAVIFLSSGVLGDGSDTATVAQNAITSANALKDLGASIYTMKIGTASATDFDSNAFLEAISSKHLAPTSMTEFGDTNPNGVTNYNQGNGTIDTTITNSMSSAVYDTSSIRIVAIPTSPIIKQYLSDALKLATGSTTVKFTKKYVAGTADSDGNITWGSESSVSGITTNYNKETKVITIKNYKYSDNYIDASHPGKKLRITISNLAANEAADLTNANISTSAGIYKSDSDTTPVLDFATPSISVPVYNYNLGFALTAKSTIGGDNAKYLSVSDTPNKQTKNTTVSSDNALEISADGKSADVNITPTSNTSNVKYLLCQTDSGNYEWIGVRFNPASNILFEENYMTNATTGNVEWATEGTALSTNQALPDANTAYGYSSAYAENTTFSNGTTLKATVDATNNRTDTKTFTFKGDAFDLISACGKTTGMLLVTVKNSEGNLIKGYIVDTYYRDNDGLASNGLLCQTPVIKYQGTYDEYTVQVTGAYLSGASAISQYSAKAENTSSEEDLYDLLEQTGMLEIDDDNLEILWFDDNSVLNSAMGISEYSARSASSSRVATPTSLDCYIDGIRIYNPLEDDSTYSDAEKGATYYNVVDKLTDSDSVNGFAFVESAYNGASLDFATYKQYGPTNEFYLKKSTSDSALAFKVTADSSSKVMLGLRSVDGSDIVVKIGGTQFTISSPTEMFYDITNCITFENGNAVVTVENTSNGLLAVNTVKVSGANLTTLSAEDMPIAYTMLNIGGEDAIVDGGVIKVLADDTTDTEDSSQSPDQFGGMTSFTNVFSMLVSIIKDVFNSIFEAMPLFFWGVNNESLH